MSKSDVIQAVKGGAYKSVLQVEESIPARIARFLDWAASEYPRSLIPMNLVYKAIMGMARTPTMDSSEVERLRSRMYAAKKHLHKVYGRTLVSEPGVGIRASVDSNDIVEGPLERAARRVESARLQADAVSALIKPSQLSAKNRSRHNDVAEALRKLSSPAVLGKLLPRPQDQTD